MVPSERVGHDVMVRVSEPLFSGACRSQLVENSQALLLRRSKQPPRRRSRVTP